MTGLSVKRDGTIYESQIKPHKFRRSDEDRHTYGQLSKILCYDQSTGFLKRIRVAHAGKGFSKVGNIKSTGYMRVKVDGIDYLYHHIVFFLNHKRWPVEVDHIDRNKQNNRIENLRESTRKQNQNFLNKPVVSNDGRMFISISEATKYMGGAIGSSLISKAVARGCKAYGFTWRFAETLIPRHDSKRSKRQEQDGGGA